WADRGEFEALAWPGVYVIAVFPSSPPKRVFPLPREVVYVGQTTRTLEQRLGEFEKSALKGGSEPHSGGGTFFEKYKGSSPTHVSVLPVRLPPGEQGGAITVLEGLLIWSYARTWKRPPSCNRK